MSLEFKRYRPKTRGAIRGIVVTNENIVEVASWCRGRVEISPDTQQRQLLLPTIEDGVVIVTAGQVLQENMDGTIKLAPSDFLTHYEEVPQIV